MRCGGALPRTFSRGEGSPPHLVWKGVSYFTLVYRGAPQIPSPRSSLSSLLANWE